MASKVIISHRRTAKREGVLSLLLFSFTIVGLLAFLHVFFPNMRERNATFYYLVHAFLLLFGPLAIFCYAVPNLFMKGEFHFTLSEDRIQCSSPAESYAESYSIPTSEIIALEEKETDESPHSWYFITDDDRRISITPNYGNPVAKIVGALERLKPGIELRRT